MDRANTGFGSNGTAAAVLRELRGERPGADASPPDQFVASAPGGTPFSHHLRSLRDGSPAVADSQAASARQEAGPDSYLSRSAPGIVRRAFERSPAASPAEGGDEGREVSQNSARTLHAEAQKP